MGNHTQRQLLGRHEECIRLWEQLCAARWEASWIQQRLNALQAELEQVKLERDIIAMDREAIRRRLFPHAYKSD